MVVLIQSCFYTSQFKTYLSQFNTTTTKSIQYIEIVDLIHVESDFRQHQSFQYRVVKNN